MSNRSMNDIVPPSRRSIRDVPLPNNRSRNNSDNQTNTDAHNDKPITETEAPSQHSKDGMPSWGIWSIAIGSIVVVVFAVSTLFTSATVELSPKTVTKKISTDITAAPDSGTEEDVALNKLTTTAKVSTSVTATSTQKVKKAAEGTIMVYNEYSEDPMQLVERTRFKVANSDRVYRATHAFRLPGMDGETPGSAEVVVRATEPGSEYNLDEMTTLTIPGLQGDPSYENVYAKTDRINGGIVGDQAQLSEETLDGVSQTLRTKLEQKLANQITKATTETWVVPDGVFSDSLNSISQGQLSEGEVTIELSGSRQASALSVPDLEEKLVNYAFPEKNYDPDKIQVTNLNELTYDMESNETETVRGTVSGDARFVWQIKDEQIKKDLSGRAKKQLGNILSGYTEVDRATAEVRPFWLRSFPQDPSDIKILRSSESE